MPCLDRRPVKPAKPERHVRRRQLRRRRGAGAGRLAVAHGRRRRRARLHMLVLWRSPSTGPAHLALQHWAKSNRGLLSAARANKGVRRVHIGSKMALGMRSLRANAIGSSPRGVVAGRGPLLSSLHSRVGAAAPEVKEAAFDLEDGSDSETALSAKVRRPPAAARRPPPPPLVAFGVSCPLPGAVGITRLQKRGEPPPPPTNPQPPETPRLRRPRRCSCHGRRLLQRSSGAETLRSYRTPVGRWFGLISWVVCCVYGSGCAAAQRAASGPLARRWGCGVPSLRRRARAARLQPRPGRRLAGRRRRWLLSGAP